MPEEILAVNTLKITKNPKMSFSVLARSGIITESILYIYNVGLDEAGVYSCGVNTNPMIMQVKLINSLGLIIKIFKSGKL